MTTATPPKMGLFIVRGHEPANNHECGKCGLTLDTFWLLTHQPTCNEIQLIAQDVRAFDRLNEAAEAAAEV